MGILLTVFQGPLLLFFLLLCCLVNKFQGLTTDGEALVNFRTNIISSDGLLRQWRPEDPDPCGWKGVTCDRKTKRVTYLNLSNHKLSGPVSPDIGKLDRLKFLDLHYNNFYGEIPPELGNCTELQGLFLQNNYLSGIIPPEIGNLSKLQTLDVSSNSLSGSIPASLGNLPNLSIFNVSNNFLAGPIPSDGVLDHFGINAFLGNRGLCGKHINQLCKDDAGGSAGSQPTGSQSAKKNSGRLLISASATVGALLLVALMCFWGCFLYKKLGKTDAKGLAMDVSGGASIVMFHGDLPYSSKDIIKKLETLNEEHVIGAGGFGTVYKLAMDDGNVFALKRIVKLNEGFDRFFERELEILGSIKHRYLVNLRGYCNSPTSKLLIYDYLSGGSLDEALHEKAELLDWDARLNIVMGAAKGLAYLHHDCSPRIIHRDIKSSNILLDGNFEARVSDFGLAKLLEDEESHITTIVAGTFGYLAPEYMQSGRATEKTDVYSFGVLVLEVISGKRPTDASFIEKGLNIVGWLNYLITEDRQREIVDMNCEGVETETLDAVLSVAIQCVSSSPEDRPTMHRVVQTLESEATFNHRLCSSSSSSLVRSSGISRRSDNFETTTQQCRLSSFLCCTPVNRGPLWRAFSSTLSITSSKPQNFLQVVACVPPSQPQKTTATFTSSTKLYVSGLSFRTSEESLRNAFQPFGQLIEVNLVMDKIANRPRGFAFLRYATKEESEKAIEGMHGKFLDGRVIFVEFSKPRSQLPQGIKQDSKPYR